MKEENEKTGREEDMARVTRAAAHLSVEEVKRGLKLDERPLYRHRWLIIDTALLDARAASEIAKQCGVCPQTGHQLISRSHRLGVVAVETPGQGGRRQGYLSRAEEQDLL